MEPADFAAELRLEADRETGAGLGTIVTDGGKGGTVAFASLPGTRLA